MRTINELKNKRFIIYVLRMWLLVILINKHNTMRPSDPIFFYNFYSSLFLLSALASRSWDQTTLFDEWTLYMICEALYDLYFSRMRKESLFSCSAAVWRGQVNCLLLARTWIQAITSQMIANTHARAHTENENGKTKWNCHNLKKWIAIFRVCNREIWAKSNTDSLKSLSIRRDTSDGRRLTRESHQSQRWRGRKMACSSAEDCSHCSYSFQPQKRCSGKYSALFVVLLKKKPEKPYSINGIGCRVSRPIALSSRAFQMKCVRWSGLKSDLNGAKSVCQLHVVPSNQSERSTQFLGVSAFSLRDW